MHDEESANVRRWRDTHIRSLSARTIAGVAMALSLFSLPPEMSGQGLPSWRFDVGVGSLYDNNILRYSDKYLSAFDHGEDPGRFHINSVDDVILVSSIRASGTMKMIGSLNTTGAVDYRRRTFTHNPVKDWSSFALSLRQDLSKQLAAQVAYSYIPEFYVRHYRDDDWVNEFGYTPPTFQSYDFKKDELGGWIQYALFSGTRVRGLVSYMRYFYNEHFTEYNCRNSLYGVELYQTVHKNLKLNAGFEVVYSRADGNAETDPSNDVNTYVLGAELQLPKAFGRVNSIGLEGEYTSTDFTTHHFLEFDKTHAGRRDYEYRVSATYSFELLDNLGLALTYGWHQRNTVTAALENAVDLANEKNYRQYQIGLEAKYTVNIVPSDDSELERSK